MWDFRRLIPKFWIQNYPTNDEWDKVLNELLDKADRGEVTVKLGFMTIFFNDKEVWAANWPYRFGHPYPAYYAEQYILPRVKTRIRLKKLIDSLQIVANQERIKNVITHYK